MIDLVHLDLHAPAIHIVAPGQVHKLDREIGSEGFVVMFVPGIQHPVLSDPRVRSLLRPGPTIGRFELHRDHILEAAVLAEQMKAERSTMEAGCNEVLENLLAILMLKCWRWSQLKKDASLPDRNDIVAQFLEKVDREFLVKKQVGAYADDLAISAGHLNELVKKRLGRTASELLHERLLLEAKRLLLHSSLSVKEVSFELGMEDPAYFTRMFRKATGTTPGEFRDHIREKYQQ